MRVAYLMNGVIGGIKGKSYENYNESSIKSNILKFTSRTHSFLQQEDIEIDYFILSWQPELEEIYIQQYNPIKIKSIPIRTFEVPEHYKDVEDNPRIQAHYSRWYGALEVSKMCKEYSLEHNINYDLLINARLDLCFTRKINLHNFDPSKFHIAKPINLPHYNWPKNNEMIDHIFISNPEYMFKFMELFSSINEYTSPGQCPHWRMISSHFLSVWHLKKLELLEHNIITDTSLKVINDNYDPWADVDYYIFRYRGITEKELENGNLLTPPYK